MNDCCNNLLYGGTILGEPSDRTPVVCATCSTTWVKKWVKLKEYSEIEQIFCDIEEWLGETDWRAWDSDYLDRYDKLKKKYLSPFPKNTENQMKTLITNLKNLLKNIQLEEVV